LFCFSNCCCSAVFCSRNSRTSCSRLVLSASAVEIVQAKRTELLKSLKNHLDSLYDKSESAYRNALLLLRIPNVHKVAAFKRETLCTIETFSLMNPHPLTMELSKMYQKTSFF